MNIKIDGQLRPILKKKVAEYKKLYKVTEPEMFLYSKKGRKVTVTQLESDNDNSDWDKIVKLLRNTTKNNEDYYKIMMSTSQQYKSKEQPFRFEQQYMGFEVKPRLGKRNNLLGLKIVEL